MFSLVKLLGISRVKIYAKAANGPQQGEDVEIMAIYDSTLGAYKLLTYGTGGSEPTTTNNAVFEDGNNAVFEDGNNLIY